MSRHLQVGLAHVYTEAVVTFKRRYHHVVFPDFGMAVKVSPAAVLSPGSGLPVGRDEQQAAHYAARHLEGLPAAKIRPVLRQALAANRESQAWACRKLGLDPDLRHPAAVAQARALVGEQSPNQHRQQYDADRQARAHAVGERRRQKAENARRISAALDVFLASDEFKADQEAARARDAELTERLKARLAEQTTPEGIATAREQRRAQEAQIKQRRERSSIP